MNKSIKKLACAAIVSIAFSACEDTGTNNTVNDPVSSSSSAVDNPVSSSSFTQSSSSFEIPVRDSRVMSYVKRSFYPYKDTPIFIIAGRDSLEFLFPDLFENEDAKCNYFAISIPDGIFGYYILSQDMTLYEIHPTSGDCDETADIRRATILVCDDTAEKNLSSKINLDIESVIFYGDPNWNCEEENNDNKGVYF